MHRLLRYFLVTLFVSTGIGAWSTRTHAQALPTPTRSLTQMPTRADIPPNLLKERSVLVVSAQPDDQGQLVPDRAREWASELQKMFAERGVDVVAGFERLTLLSGREPWVAFQELLVSRELRHLVWLQELPDGTFRISLAELPEEAPLLRPSVTAYTLEAADLQTLVLTLRREIIRANLERENHMVLEQPEFFMDAPMITKNRFESFPLDLKLDKVAIRWPEDMRNGEMRAFGLHLDSLYPYTFDFVSPELTDKEIQNEGFQYVLDWVYAPGLAVRQIFDYELTDGESSYVTFITLGPNEKEIKSISIHRPVYKFYMRHLITGDLYLGKEWDADVTWTDSLKHFIFNYRDWLANNGRRR